MVVDELQWMGRIVENYHTLRFYTQCNRKIGKWHWMSFEASFPKFCYTHARCKTVTYNLLLIIAYLNRLLTIRFSLEKNCVHFILIKLSLLLIFRFKLHECTSNERIENLPVSLLFLWCQETSITSVYTPSHLYTHQLENSHQLHWLKSWNSLAWLA